MSEPKVLLKVNNLMVAYGGIEAVKGITMEVREGELVSLIGSNGAGKTTTMKAITGTLAASSGSIEYLGKNIQGQGAWDLVKQGLVMVPEGRGVFTRMSILENLQMGAYLRNDKDGIAADVERVFTLFPRLKERSTQLAGTLSGGEQQRVAIARAVANSPRILLADEPTGNLDPVTSEIVFETLLTLVRVSGVAALIATHNLALAARMDRRVTLADGVVVELD